MAFEPSASAKSDPLRRIPQRPPAYSLKAWLKGLWSGRMKWRKATSITKIAIVFLHYTNESIGGFTSPSL